MAILMYPRNLFRQNRIWPGTLVAIEEFKFVSQNNKLENVSKEKTYSTQIGTNNTNIGERKVEEAAFFFVCLLVSF